MSRDTLRKYGKPKIDDSLKLNGEPIHIRALSGEGRTQYIELIDKHKENGGLKTEYVAALGVCNQSGDLDYDINKPEDIAELAAFDGELLSSICRKLIEISGLAANSVEDAAKNSDASPNSSSGSSSPPTSSTAP